MSSKNRTLGRRRFLRGTLVTGAGVTVGLPVLNIMLNENGTALAAEAPLPRRFGTFHWGNGILHEAWVPSQTGFDWELSDSLSPFETLNPALKEYMTLVTGTNHKPTNPGHIPARGLALSSSHNNTYVEAELGAGYRKQEMPEPSVDVIVREAWQGATGPSGRDSIHLSITEASPYHGNSSWLPGGYSYNQPEATPQALFNALFSSGFVTPPDPGGSANDLLAVTSQLEQSMLDAVMGDIAAMKSGLGYVDRIRLDDHLQGLRALESRIQQVGSPVDPIQCELPPEPGSGALTMKAKSELMNQLLATAITCDITRVFSYEWSANQSEYVYAELGISGGHHNDVSHELTNPARQEDKRKIMRLIMGAYAHLAELLRASPEGDGNVLDNTLMLATSEHANADKHDWRDHPFLLVGKAGGTIASGQHWRHPDPAGNSAAPEVLLTAVRAVGVQVQALGQADSTEGNRQATETISALEV